MYFCYTVTNYCLEIIIAPELPIAARALNVVSTGINTGATKIVEVYLILIYAHFSDVLQRRG